MKIASNFQGSKKFEPMKKIMIFGTFDILHKGHLNLFKQAREYGDYLIAVIARDRTVKEVKARKPRNNEKKRLNAVKRFVDKAVLGRIRDKYKIIETYKPDIICLGYDQNSFTKELRKELVKRRLKTRIVRLKAYKAHRYKSSKIQ